jgi:ArsR family transcriptional regulator, arsenate/arsenite/antimonite-responsive transcriptional repressor
MPDSPTRPTSADFQDYLELQRALRALGDEVRLNIVRVLAGQGEVNVTDLAATLIISQPLVSWHLGSLRRAGLVHKRRQGREVYISLDTGRYRAVLRQLGALVPSASREAPPEQPAAPDSALAPAETPGILRGR